MRKHMKFTYDAFGGYLWTIGYGMSESQESNVKFDHVGKTFDHFLPKNLTADDFCGLGIKKQK